jgi:hypothetical protein
MKIPEVLHIVPQTEGETKAIASTLLDYVLEDGTMNILELKTVLNRLSKVIEYVEDNENYKQAIQQEAGKYPDKKFTVGRFTYSKGARTTYDYTPDPTWKEIKSKLDARQETMKAINEEMCDADGVMIYPAIKKSTEFITVKPLE